MEQRAIFSGAMPMPVSATSKRSSRSSPFLEQPARAAVTEPCSVNLTALLA
jgi:hypothetical protein